MRLAELDAHGSVIRHLEVPDDSAVAQGLREIEQNQMLTGPAVVEVEQWWNGTRATVRIPKGHPGAGQLLRDRNRTTITIEVES